MKAQEELNNQLIIEAVEHFEQLISKRQWSREEKLTWHGLMKFIRTEAKIFGEHNSMV
jgi:hypothetical protein